MNDKLANLASNLIVLNQVYSKEQLQEFTVAQLRHYADHSPLVQGPKLPPGKAVAKEILVGLIIGEVWIYTIQVDCKPIKSSTIVPPHSLVSQETSLLPQDLIPLIEKVKYEESTRELFSIKKLEVSGTQNIVSILLFQKISLKEKR